jgi:hypothetical protein
MIPDKLLINLKIISKIQKNGRITRSYDGIISLENNVFYQAIKRFISSDSRKQAIFEINSIISESISILNHILNSKYMNKTFNESDEYIKNCENITLIISELELSKQGIENLKFTYQNDPNIVSQIDILILKINTTIKDVNTKLSYFKSFLQSESKPPLLEYALQTNEIYQTQTSNWNYNKDNKDFNSDNDNQNDQNSNTE